MKPLSVKDFHHFFPFFRVFSAPLHKVVRVLPSKKAGIREGKKENMPAHRRTRQLSTHHPQALPQGGKNGMENGKQTERQTEWKTESKRKANGKTNGKNQTLEYQRFPPLLSVFPFVFPPPTHKYPTQTYTQTTTKCKQLSRKQTNKPFISG